MSKSHYNGQFFDGVNHTSRLSAETLVPLLIELLSPKSVLDVGCGQGAWLQKFIQSGVEDCNGIDGDYVEISELLIPTSRFISMNLEEVTSLDRRFDLVICLEVAEHLPASRAEQLVSFLTNHGQSVVFSAAIPGQGGTHHVNERWQSYWKALFEARGWRVFDPLRPRIWNNTSIAFWYRQNMFVMLPGESEKCSMLGDLSMDWPPDLVHPELFNRKVREMALDNCLTLGVVARRVPSLVWKSLKYRFSRAH